MIFELIQNIIIYVFIIYGSLVLMYYLWMTFSAIFELKKYRHSTNHVYYDKIISSNYAPGISVIAPAFNEELNIVMNVKSLLSLYYNKYEVVVVNDGSKDNTLEKLIDEFELEKVDYYYEYKLECHEVRGVYRSRNRLYYRLVVIDKANGGKADALNAGINLAKFELCASIDVDCVLDNMVLLKLVKPFLDDPQKVIAVGGTVQVANDSIIKNGRMIKFNLPKSFMARMQVLEYIRAFIIGRLSWSSINGLILVSGALGLFKKKVLINAGGYYKDTVGEDIELVVRMRKYMHNKGFDSRVVYIPEPLCWTEAPEDISILIRQRNRWTRGAIDTLLKHKDLLFNYKYKSLGLFAMPYWYLIEWFSPIVQAFGFLSIIYIVVFHTMDFHVLGLLTLISFSFYWILSIIALILEEKSNKKRIEPKVVSQLLILVFLEPFIYHPITIYAALKGNIDYLRGKNSWGNMNRKGLK